MMWKKLAVLFVVLALVCSMVVGCTSKPTQSSGEQPGEKQAASEPAKKPKLGAVMIDLNHPFYAQMMEAGNEAAKDFEVEVIWKSAEGSLEKEIALVENFIEQKVDCILIDPINREGVKSVVEKAHAAGIPVVTMGNFVDTPWNVNTLYNDYEDTKRIAQIMGTYLGGKGNVVLLVGSPGNWCSDERERGFKDGIKEFPDIKLLSVQPSDWDPAKGMKVMENWLASYPKIDALMCISDAVTLAAIEAIKAAGRLDEIAVFSYDGEKAASERMKQGEIKVDLLTGPKRVGYWNIKVGAQLARGEKLPRIVYLPTYFVMNEDMAEIVRKAGLDKDIKIVSPDEAIRLFDGYREELGPKK